MTDSSTIVGIDPDLVSRWIRGLGISASGRLTFERIGLGQSNLTYLVCDEAGHRWVLRRPPLGALLASAHDVQREARILDALTDTEVPTPRVLGVTDDPAIGESPLVLLEFVDGLVLDRTAVAESVAPERRRDIGLSMASTLATVHTVDLESVGLVDLASHKPYAGRQLKRWSGQWEKSKTRESPALDALTRRLVAAQPEQQELTLVHGDFHIRNVIAEPDSGAVAAVLDWELCTLGDPLADMGSLLAYWVEAGEDNLPGFGITALEGFPGRDELAEVYLTRSGRDPAALRYWHTLGLWKIAVIAEGVLRRALDEPQNKAASGTPSTEIIDTLVARAHGIADEAGI